MWILLQGKKEPLKMQSKSHQHLYVSFNNGSNSILYYNTETQKILKSWNYCFLTPLQQISPPEEIEVTPYTLCEGEKESGTWSPGDRSPSTSDKRKQDDEEFEPRKTRGLKYDYHNYHYLNIPFSDEEANDAILTSDDQQYAIIAGNELTSLKDAQQSPDWLEWEHAAYAELAQLQQMRTWKLVEKPPDAIPIANKWMFIKKRNKVGKVIKHKAQLVAKGCTQHPGHNYVETFSPVVHMETIQAILALVLIEGLKIQQMDIKGVYLNRILKEKVYMQQPEGYEDGTKQVCKLVKTVLWIGPQMEQGTWCQTQKLWLPATLAQPLPRHVTGLVRHVKHCWYRNIGYVIGTLDVFCFCWTSIYSI